MVNQAREVTEMTQSLCKCVTLSGLGLWVGVVMVLRTEVLRGYGEKHEHLNIMSALGSVIPK